MIDHVSIQVGDPAASEAFYAAVLAPLGAEAKMRFGPVVGWGDQAPWFWTFPTGEEGGPAPEPANREVHLAFRAPDRATVRAFFEAAVAAGAEVLHEPKVWPEYHEHYYGAFVRDPDGNNVEAVCHQPEAS